MADTDKGLEVMEDELRLVKGEIKRTLVDLRSAVMQADSPFQRIVASPQAAPPSVSQASGDREERTRVVEVPSSQPAAQPAQVPAAPQQPIILGQAWPTGIPPVQQVQQGAPAPQMPQASAAAPALAPHQALEDRADAPPAPPRRRPVEPVEVDEDWANEEQRQQSNGHLDSPVDHRGPGPRTVPLEVDDDWGRDDPRQQGNDHVDSPRDGRGAGPRRDARDRTEQGKPDRVRCGQTLMGRSTRPGGRPDAPAKNGRRRQEPGGNGAWQSRRSPMLDEEWERVANEQGDEPEIEVAEIADEDVSARPTLKTITSTSFPARSVGSSLRRRGWAPAAWKTW